MEVQRQRQSGLALSILVLAGCGQSPEASNPAEPGKTPAAAPVPAVVKVDDTVRLPATLDEAARMLDLRTFPLPELAKPEVRRSLGSLNYQAKGDLKTAMDYVHQQLAKQGWQELPDRQATNAYLQSFFTRAGYVASASLTTSAEAPGSVRVSISSYGNIRPAQQPVPADVKLEHQFPHHAGWVTTAKMAETAKACRKLLLAEGWQPYDEHTYDQKFAAGHSLEFKRNVILLDVSVTTHENRPGQTMISYTTRLLSADLPAPPQAQKLEYDNDGKKLRCTTPTGVDDVADFYRQELGKQGWKPTTNPQGLTSMALVFYNHGKDMIALEIDGRNGPTKVAARFYTAAEREDINALIKKAEERRDKAKPD